MFVSYSVNSSHTHLPLLCPQAHSLYLCPENRLIIITIFLDFICSLTWYLFFSFWITSLFTIGSRFILSLQLMQINSFLWLRISHCIYVQQRFYPFICWCTSRLLSRPGYCKHRCNEHWGTGVFSNYEFLSTYRGWTAGGEGDDRGWDGWMVSLTLWTWVWVNSGSWWWTGRPGVLQFMGSQRVGHDWATELNWTEY